MDQKHLMMSALGVGVGVGIGLVSGHTVSKWAGSGSNPIALDVMEQEMLNCIVDGKDSKVTFDEFPYYLSEQTRVLLTSAAFVHLKSADFAKHTRNLSPASRTILLSGPAELYPQMLARALAHYFGAKLLLLDVTDFSLKIQSKYGGSRKESSFKRSISETTLNQMSELFGSFSMLHPKEEKKGSLRRQSSGVDFASKGIDASSSNPPTLRRNASSLSNMSNLASHGTASNPGSLMRTSSLSIDEKLLIQALYKVLVKVSKTSPIILYIRDAEKQLCRSERVYVLLEKMLRRLSGSVLILGSRIVDSGDENRELDERISSIFHYNIEIKLPEEEETHLVSWKSQLEEDMKMIQFQDNKNHIMEVLAANDIECDDLGSICISDVMALSNYIEEVVVSAISYHLMKTKDVEYRNGKLVISSTSLSRGMNIFKEGKSAGKDTLKLETEAELSKKEPRNGEEDRKRPEIKAESSIPPEKKSETEIKAESSIPPEKKSEIASESQKVLPDNEYEKRIRPEVIPAKEIGVTFADIGALDEIKESLQELVMLPLRRPDLFKGGLLKPCRGILLFGPPGTGKTMLAKAIAKEAGASFINVSMSTITSKWFGEDEKNVRALFSLAAKVSPTIIFVDEVDSMLGQRSRAGEHEAMRKIKNEFMAHWDGLLTKPGERILVLAATNRPFDLDEAIIRRFERRIMVGLPTVEQREKILKTLLTKETVDKGLDLKQLASMTEGYSGSDLKNLCTAAAYQPVRELIKQERHKDLEKKRLAVEGNDSDAPTANEDTKERVIAIRPLSTSDFREAKNQVAASFAAEGSIMNELKQWNGLYGEGGSRKKEQLTYFL
ncbi:hypothetical protein DM860_007103 [Cuscuta australis]|uniref:AAA+ ATPase domain-containing protein n=1 Tax=Cuscuta australis TaxID=267555 RepID=A0A328EA95_9ASTE|nr:hypothetical protein DM860_007103 [Cuscuta australis]